MFQRKDYLEYFNQLARTEKAMEKTGRHILRHLRDEKARGLVKSLVLDEQRHFKIVKEIKILFFGRHGTRKKRKKRS